MQRQIRGTVALKGVMTIRRGAKVHRYLRIKGRPLVPLPDAPLNSPEFLAAYAAALKESGGKVKAPTGTIRAAIEAYLRSDKFLSLSKVYQHTMRRECEAIAEQAEDAQLRHLRREHIRADLNALPGHRSRKRQKAWRQLCGWALEAGLIENDPSESIKRKAIPKTMGHLAWTRDDVDKFRARWPIGSVTRAVFELLYFSGSRIGDGVKLGPGMVGRDGVLTFVQSKTGDKAYVPWTCKLPAYAAHMQADRDMMHAALSHTAGHMTYLATRHGQTRSDKAIGGMITNAAREAGVDKSAHGLRKARAVALAEGGATALQIGAWTGHHTLTEVANYTAEMDRKSAVIG